MDLSNLLKILPSLLNGDSSLSSILELLVGDNQSLSNITTMINSLIDGSITLKDLLPILVPIVLQFLTKPTENENAPENSVAFTKTYGIEPIKDVADEKTIAELINYFDNPTAS